MSEEAKQDAKTPTCPNCGNLSFDCITENGKSGVQCAKCGLKYWRAPSPIPQPDDPPPSCQAESVGIEAKVRDWLIQHMLSESEKFNTRMTVDEARRVVDSGLWNRELELLAAFASSVQTPYEEQEWTGGVSVTGRNYIANSEQSPTEVLFQNGRVVRIVDGALEVGLDPNGAAMIWPLKRKPSAPEHVQPQTQDRRSAQDGTASSATTDAKEAAREWLTRNYNQHPIGGVAFTDIGQPNLVQTDVLARMLRDYASHRAAAPHRGVWR